MLIVFLWHYILPYILLYLLVGTLRLQTSFKNKIPTLWHVITSSGEYEGSAYFGVKRLVNWQCICSTQCSSSNRSRPHECLSYTHTHIHLSKLKRFTYERWEIYVDMTFAYKYIYILSVFYNQINNRWNIIPILIIYHKNII